MVERSTMPAVAAVEDGEEHVGLGAGGAVADPGRVGRRLVEERARTERQQAAMVGDTLAATGSNGVTLSGSALDVTRQNLVESEYERLVGRRQRAMEIDNLKYEAAAAKSRGKQAMFGGILGAAGSAASAFAPAPGTGLGSKASFNGFGSYLGVGRK